MGMVGPKIQELNKKAQDKLFGPPTTEESSTAELGDIPTVEPIPIPIASTQAIVTKLVDGDTLWVQKQENEEPIKVRLLGIDTPESVHQDKDKNSTYGKMASDYFATMVQEGDTVYLQYDVEQTDCYGRTLAYVWDTPVYDDASCEQLEHLYNARLVREGYARALCIPPNNRYATEFLTYQTQAQDEKAGLWGVEGFQSYYEKMYGGN